MLSVSQICGKRNDRSTLRVGIHTHNLRSREAKEGAPQIPGQPGLHMGLKIALVSS